MNDLGMSQRRFAAICLAVCVAIVLGALFIDASRNDTPDKADVSFQREAEKSVQSLRECLTLAEKAVEDLERTARSRDRWKIRALAAEGASS